MKDGESEDMVTSQLSGETAREIFKESCEMADANSYWGLCVSRSGSKTKNDWLNFPDMRLMYTADCGRETGNKAIQDEQTATLPICGAFQTGIKIPLGLRT